MIDANRQHLPFHAIGLEAASREGIYAVCFCFLFSIAAHFTHLPIWISALVIFSLGWRSLQNAGLLKPVGKWLLVPLVVIGGFGVFAEYWTIVGRDAGLALLTVMTSFKVLETRTHRDLLILVFLCYFLIATHFLFSQSIFTATLMLLTLIVITATLITINQREARPDPRETLLIAARLVGLSIPLMAVLFVLVPRVPGPLWGITNEQRGGVTGLSNFMAPGEISNLIRSNEVAFRVDFEGTIPPRQQLYWRGPVMSVFNGRRWHQAHRPAISPLQMLAVSDGTSYTVTLEPNGEHWLLALDIPVQQVKGSLITADYQLTSIKPINDLRRYSLESRLGYRIGIEEEPEYLAKTAEYPENSNPRTIELGRQLAMQYPEKTDIIGHVLRMFRDQEYTYTLQPPLLRGDVVDQFLFESRRGFCEHFAGSFALLMRAAGIPSRIVTGYQGGEFNAVGNYLIVRQSDAHAWTEVWLEGRGWVRVDPTAAVSPSRIEQGIDEALPEETAIFRIEKRNPLFGRLLFAWDNLQHSWNDWVINYDDRKQQRFLSRLDIGIENAGDMVIALIIVLSGVSALFWSVGWYRGRPPRAKLHERHFRRFLKKMARRGFEKPASEDYRDYLQRLRQAGVDQLDVVSEIIGIYIRIKYAGDRNPAPGIERLGGLVKQVRA